MLSDSQELQQLQEDEMIDGDAVTSLAVVEAGGGGGMRLSRQRATRGPSHSLPVPRDAEGEMDGRASEELAALPISETEERPGRRARSGGGFFKVLMVGALLVGGAWFGGKYYRAWFGGEQAGSGASANSGESASAGEAKPAAADKEKTHAGGAEAANPGSAAGAAAADAGAKAKLAAGQGSEAAAPEEGKSEKPAREPAREPVARRNRPPAERVKEKDRNIHSIDLKSMMAPNPSQLPRGAGPEAGAAARRGAGPGNPVAAGRAYRTESGSRLGAVLAQGDTTSGP